ncbi:small integral membrane protein 8-like [Diadema setosum]|uniref:small integral membrane protein 8-like n=1 Tax=Diadema setosum TaxID=31175 RepID=UPI003B3BB081
MAEKKKSSTPEIKVGGNPGGNSAGDGIRSVRSTSLFRAVNFELYAKPNKYVMGFGVIALTGCVIYVAYLNAQKENQRDREMYEQFRADGTTMMKPRSSRWD